ncbi:MAG: hypothetical protein SFX18_06845 [Pirellulales bacterium]|nr:hypothetical protein [Pirellulales bacterium]
MKTIFAVTAPVLLFGYLTVLLADDKPQVVDIKQIEENIQVATGEEFAIVFNRDGNKLSQPSKSQETRDPKMAIKVKLALTSASPGLPPREGAKRPYLEVVNEYEKTLHFRALVRMKGSKQFFEIHEGIEPVAAKESMCKCWDFDSLVEEIMLYEFKLSDPPSE